MATVIKTTFQLKRASEARWKELNLILAAGEPGFELDTGRLKIGNGQTPWKELDYIGGHNLTEEEVRQLIEEYLSEFKPSETVVGDDSSIVITDGKVSLAGFLSAQNNTFPQKQEDGVLRWVKPQNTKTIVEVPKNGALTVVSGYHEDTDTQVYKLDFKMPLATGSILGGVLSAQDIEVDGKKVAAPNQIYVAPETGKMSVKKITTDILQNGEEELILNAGTASQNKI